jgi:mono/diheme cytochrome c family protein
MRAVFATAAMIAALAASSLSSAQSIDRGRELARVSCAMCHAIGDAGDSPNAMAPPFRELGRRYAWDALAAAIAQGMLLSHPAMPDMHFTRGETDDLIAYMKSIQSRGAPRDGMRPPNQPYSPH